MRPVLFLLLCSTLAGAAGALGAALFRETLRALELLVLGRHLLGPQGSLVHAATLLPVWQRVLFPAAGGLVAGLALQFGARYLKDDQPTDYLEAVRVGTGDMSVRAAAVRGFSSLWSVASGGSLGREGSMVQVSATVGSIVSRWAGMSAEHRHIVVASAAAAGLATAYNAPLAASLFVAELGLGSIKMGKLAPILLASSIGARIAHVIFGSQPLFASRPADHSHELLLGLLCGLAAGLAGPFYLSFLHGAKRHFARLPWPLAARMTFGGLLVGLLSAIQPAVWGNGYSVIHSILNDPWVPAAVGGILVLKLLATACTTGSGAVGGIFTPTLLMGACLGSLLGFLPGCPQTGAILGMGGLLAATTHAPVMAILMLLELTGDLSMSLSLTATCVVAYTVALTMGSSSIYGDPE